MTLAINYTPTNMLVAYANNARTHSPEQVAQIAASITEFGFTNPVLVDAANCIIAGHGRVLAAKQLGLAAVPTIMLHGLTDAQRRAYIIADNKLALNAGWDEELLAREMQALQAMDYKLDVLGFTMAEINTLLTNLEGGGAQAGGETQKANGALAARFLVSPFSVIDARNGAWQERKQAWAARIGDQGESREHTLAVPGSIMEDIGSVSILDGALAETMLHWFAKPNWCALDPFAGDSVFGFVACSMGLNFIGIELRPEQAALNQQRLESAGLAGIYHCDTSENLNKYVVDDSVDFVFSCPPYADLEVYSDDPKDLSNMPNDQFFPTYAAILGSTYAKLRKNRFACIATSEVRGKDGAYIGLVPKTIEAMCAAGYKFYNELVLVTPCGTLPQRAGRAMQSGRKVGRTHQNVLIFYKGDIKAIGKTLGTIEMPEAGEDGL